MITSTSLAERIDAIVIGGSAGCVETLSVLLPSLPVNFRPPVFIAVHLLRDQPSLLADIFRARCAIEVKEVEDKERICEHSVYFAPSDYHLLVADRNELSLSVDDPVNFSRPSIDVLFESAAVVYKDRLMGVVLTGANADGAEGLDVVRRSGGVTVVQHPSSAIAPTMPLAALAMGSADFVLNPKGIAELLLSIASDTTVHASVK